MAHRGQGASVRIGQFLIGVMNGAVHSLVGAHPRRSGTIGCIAVLPAPGHIEKRFSTWMGRADRIAESLGKRVHICVQKGRTQGCFLALSLQGDKVPGRRSDLAQRGRIRCMVHHAVASRRSAIVQQLIACAAGHLRNQTGQIVGGCVAVAEKKHPLGLLRIQPRQAQTHPNWNA